MGKKNTFGKFVSKYELYDWTQCSEREITVAAYAEGYLYGTLEIDGEERQIRLSRNNDSFQICDGTFDRWANSVGAEVRFPLTQAEFDKALEHLCSIPLDKLRAESESGRRPR